MVKPNAYIIKHDNADKFIAFERGDVIGVFNFHGEKSYSDYRFGVSRPGKYTLILNSDEIMNGGFDRIKTQEFFSQDIPCNGFKQSISVYAPARTCFVLAYSN